MRACLDQFVARRLPVIPVLLPNAPRKPTLPVFLRAFTWVDLREGISKPGIDAIQWGITGMKPADFENLVGSLPADNPDIDLDKTRLSDCLQRFGVPSETSDKASECVGAFTAELVRNPSVSLTPITVQELLADFVDESVIEPVSTFFYYWLHSYVPRRILSRCFYLSDRRVAKLYRSCQPQVSTPIRSETTRWAT